MEKLFVLALTVLLVPVMFSKPARNQGVTTENKEPVPVRSVDLSRYTGT